MANHESRPPIVSVVSERAWVPPGVPWVPALFHAWGIPDPAGVPDIQCYAHLTQSGPSGLQWGDWSSAEFVLLPFDWSHTAHSSLAAKSAAEVARRARETGRRLLVFYWSDDDRPIDVPDAIVFRTSLRRNRRYWRTAFALPGWLQDPLELASPSLLTPRAWSPRPRVGFCGLTAPAGAHDVRLRRVRRALRGFGYRLGLYAFPDLTPALLRRAALDVLARDPRLETVFVERSAFFGGAALPDGSYDKHKREEVRLEYVSNLLNTDYTLCVRGAGNFSHRYFDTLAAGRIPVLVDTGGGIPFDFAIDWRQCGPVVPAELLHELPSHILNFHSRLGPNGFRERLISNRTLFRRYLSPEGFFGQFALHFSSTLHEGSMARHRRPL